jgi:predicted nucleic acid-binding protein
LSANRRTAAYLDSSALVKLAVPEPETAALRAELEAWDRYVSSALVQTEVVRACARVGIAARRVAERLVATLDLVTVSDEILNAAARLKPLELRTLDAIHVASAQALGSTLGVVIAYDERLVQAAKAAKLATAEPR